MIPTKDPVENLTQYLKKETAEAGVKVELGKSQRRSPLKSQPGCGH